MNPKVSLCALHEGYDRILPAAMGQLIPEDFSGSADVLNPQEAKWRDIYHFLVDRGLELRPRYRPGWIPSWIGTELGEWDYEDGIMEIVRAFCRGYWPFH